MKWGKLRPSIPSRFLMEMRGETERAQALAAAARDESVQRAHAERHALVDAGTGERVRRRRLDGAGAAGGRGAEAVERPAEAVERAAEKIVGHLDAELAPAGADGLGGGGVPLVQVVGWQGVGAEGPGGDAPPGRLLVLGHRPTGCGPAPGGGRAPCG